MAGPDNQRVGDQGALVTPYFSETTKTENDISGGGAVRSGQRTVLNSTLM